MYIFGLVVTYVSISVVDMFLFSYLTKSHVNSILINIFVLYLRSLFVQKMVNIITITMMVDIKVSFGFCIIEPRIVIAHVLVLLL